MEITLGFMSKLLEVGDFLLLLVSQNPLTDIDQIL